MSDDDKYKGYDFDGDDPFDDDAFSNTSSDGLGEEKPAEPIEEPVPAVEPSASEKASTDALDDDFAGFGGVFDEEETQQPADGGKKKGKSGGGGIVGMLKENYLYIVAAIVIIVVLYYMYGMLFPSRPQSQPRPQQQQQQRGFGLTSTPTKVPTTVQPKQQAKPTAQPVKTASTNTTTSTSGRTASGTATTQAQPENESVITRKDLETLVKGFTKVVDDNNKQVMAQIQSISSAESTLSTSAQNNAKMAQQEAANAKAAITKMTTDLTDLNNTLKQTNTNIATITKSLIRTQTQLRLLLAQKAQSRDHLSLRAVVPGRAWLVNQAGQTKTVAVGDTIKNYGTVQQIDAKNAQVVMSSGYVFN